MSGRSGDVGHVLAGVIPSLGEGSFEKVLLESLFPLLPAASCSVYLTGTGCAPVLFLSASHGIPDTTTDCWRAYLSGPHRGDCTLYRAPPASSAPSQISHITAQEVPPEHRTKVYEAHGMAERVSIVEPREDGALFAINFYRHQHQRPFSDTQIDAFEALAPALLALTRKHLTLRPPARPPRPPAERRPDQSASLAAQLQALHPALTLREREVCAGILQGLTTDGIACQLGLSAPTVKTYRNRAFARLGIHFRNELFALMLKATGH